MATLYRPKALISRQQTPENGDSGHVSVYFYIFMGSIAAGLLAMLYMFFTI